jgi:FRG domain
MGDRSVGERRKDHFKQTILSGSTAEVERFWSAVAEQADWFAHRWCSLFDDWARDPTAYVFADGYALIFFLCVLNANMNVALHGQVNADWRVTTSLYRWQKSKGEEATKRARLAADQFVARISEWMPLKTQYPGGLREDHREAVCQHYGFPTEYIDVTFAYDVALFFAEDWKEIRREPMPELGAI